MSSLRVLVAALVTLVTAMGGIVAIGGPARADDPTCIGAHAPVVGSSFVGSQQFPVAADDTSTLRLTIGLTANSTVYASFYTTGNNNAMTDVNAASGTAGTTTTGSTVGAAAAVSQGTNQTGVSPQAQFDVNVLSSTAVTFHLALSETSAADAPTCGYADYSFAAPTAGANADIVQASIHTIPADGTTTSRVSVRSFGPPDATGASTPGANDPVYLYETPVDNYGSNPPQLRDAYATPVITAQHPATSTSGASSSAGGASTTDASGTAIYTVTETRDANDQTQAPDQTEDVYRFFAYDAATHEIVGGRHNPGQRGNDYEEALNGDDIIGFGKAPLNEDTQTSVAIGNDSQSNGGTPMPTGTAPADGVSSVTVSVTLAAQTATGGRDAPILDSADVRLSSSGSAIVTPLQHNPDPGTNSTPNTFVFTVVDNTPETVTLTPFDNTHNITIAQTATITFNPVEADAELSTYDVTPQPATAGGHVSASGDGLRSVTVTEHVRDAAGHAAVGHSVTLFATSGTAVISPSNATTDGGGNATFNVSSTQAPQTVTLEVQDSTEGSLVLKAPTIDFSPGAASSTRSSATLVNGTSGTTARALPAGQASGASIQVKLVDAAGNVAAGRAVSLDEHSGRSVISGNGATTDANGIVSFAVSDAHAETDTYDVNVPGDNTTLQARPQVTFVPGPVSAATSTLLGAPAAGDVGGPDVTLTGVLRDANGIAIPGQAVVVGAVAQGSGATPDCTGGTARFLASTAASGTAPGACASLTTDANGTASVVATDTTAETLDAVIGLANSSGTFAGGPVAPATTISFAGPVSASASTVTVSATSVPATSNSAATVTVSLVDAAGRPIVGRTVTLDTGSASPTVQPATPGSNVTNGTGRAVLRVNDLNSEVARIQAVDATDADTPVGPLVTVTFTGPPSQAASTVSVSGTTAPADGTTPTTLTAVVKDRLGHVVPNEVVSLTLPNTSAVFTQATDAGGTRTLSPPQAANGGLTLTTGATGTVSATVTDTVAELATVNANESTGFGSFGQQPTITFFVPSGEAAKSTVTASPATTPAGSGSSTVTVALKDSMGPITGSSHTLVLSTGSATVTATDPTATTDPTTGVATFSVTSTRVGSQRFYATDTTTSPATTLSQTAVVTFTGTPTEASESTVTAVPVQLTIDKTATVTVSLADGVGSGFGGDSIQLSADHGSIADSPVVAGSGANDANTATFEVTDDTAETATYTATDLTTNVVLEDTAQIVWTPPTPEAQSSTVAVSPSSVAADGVATSQLTIALVGTGNAPLVNDYVQLNPSSGRMVVSTVTNPTDGRGRAVFNLTDTRAETVTITVIDKTTQVTLARQAVVTFTAPTPATSAEQVQPSTGAEAGGTRVSVQGTGLGAITGLLFGSVSATGVTVVSATTVTAVSPAGTGTVPVTLSDGRNTYAAGTFAYQPGTSVGGTTGGSSGTGSGIGSGSTGSGSGTPVSGTPTPTTPATPTSPAATAAAPVVATPTVTSVVVANRLVTVRRPAAVSLTAAVLAASREGHRRGSAGVVVLANARSTNDVAVAEALAHHVHGVLLTTTSPNVDAATATEFARVATRTAKIYVVASTGEVSVRGLAALTRRGRTSVRLSAAGPSGTSVAVQAAVHSRGVVLADAGETLTVAEAGAYAARRGDLLVLTSHGALTTAAKNALRHVTVTAVFGRAGGAHQKTGTTVSAAAAADRLLAQAGSPNSVIVTDGSPGSVLEALIAAPVISLAILVGPTVTPGQVATLRGFGGVVTVTAYGAAAPTVVSTLAALGAS